jgi:hypothetical protein
MAPSPTTPSYLSTVTTSSSIMMAWSLMLPHNEPSYHNGAICNNTLSSLHLSWQALPSWLYTISHAASQQALPLHISAISYCRANSPSPTTCHHMHHSPDYNPTPTPPDNTILHMGACHPTLQHTHTHHTILPSYHTYGLLMPTTPKSTVLVYCLYIASDLGAHPVPVIPNYLVASTCCMTSVWDIARAENHPSSASIVLLSSP